MLRLSMIRSWWWIGTRRVEVGVSGVYDIRVKNGCDSWGMRGRGSYGEA